MIRPSESLGPVPSGRWGRRRLAGPLALLPLLTLALLQPALTGCFSGKARKQKTKASAIWVGNASETLEAGTVARLKDSGVEEAYVAVARFEPDADQVLERFKTPDLGSSLPTTLAIRGKWPIDGAGRAEDLAQKVSAAAEQLRFDVESRGMLVVGLHFDFISVSDFSSYATFLSAINKELAEELFLSVSLQRQWIDDEDLEAVVDSVDYVVPFLYGQRVNERDSGESWDFSEMERRLLRLEELKVPYQLGVITLGTASWISASGELKARTTRRAMADLLDNARLKIRPGFSFEAANRRVYVMGAERRTKVGDWELQPGDTVRMVRSATSDIEELLRLVDVWQLPHHLGQMFYRLPSEEEGLSLHSESLLLALDPEAASPEIELDVSVQRRTGRGWLMRFGLRGQNREFTELALLENNYLQIVSESGVFNRNVRTGDFNRFEIFKLSETGEPQTVRRNPNMLRLHLPILEGNQKASTGDVEVIGRGDPALVLEASFLLPDGRTLKVGPKRWRDGGFVGEAGGS